MCKRNGLAVYRIPRIVIDSENRTFLGDEALLTSRGVAVDVLQDADCIRMMTTFIRDHPSLWNEDIGV